MTAALKGKAIVITGSGRGMGEAYARLAAAEGARVVVNDIDASEAERVSAEIRAAGGEAVAKTADISSWNDAENLVQFCVSKFGSLDGFVNNAALYHMALPQEETEARVRRLFEVNVLGAAFCGYAALRQMLKQRSGSLVNITSGSHSGAGAMSAYASSKGAVASMVYAWAMDTEGSGVRVNGVSPIAQTRMHDATSEFHDSHGLGPIPAALAIPPENNAPIVIYLLSDQSRAIHGQIVRIQGRAMNIVTHPAALSPGVEQDSWTVERVAKAFDAQLAAQKLPLGMHSYEVKLRPYNMPYEGPKAQK